MTATILRADAGALPLPDASVDLIVTSPPYWALRSYTDGGEHYTGQIGAEPTPAAYIDSLIDCTREWMRVLKPSGSLWVNLGDKYNSAASGQNLAGIDDRVVGHARGPNAKRYAGERGRSSTSVGQKSLIGLPWRYALRCIDDLGLILRAEVIWAKPNGLPESATDRVRRSHETWFHFTREPRYFSAVDAIREPASDYARPRNGNRTTPPPPGNRPRAMADTVNPLGKLPGSVWEIATQPLTVPAELGIDHFAAFPMEWPRRIIQGWSPSGICTACGEGRRPVVDKTHDARRPSGVAAIGRDYTRSERANGHTVANVITTATITGEACACPDTSAPTRPAVVLDPFGGTGTTALVADALGRLGVSGDMSADYCRLARWRTNDPGERARAMEVPRPPAVANDQLDLFSEVVA